MKARPISDLWYEISEGDAGIYETVNYMWHYALRDTKEPLIKNLVSSLKGKNDISTIKNIYDWVWKNVDYELDPSDREMLTAPIHYVNKNRRTGDCDCMTTLLVCLLETAGFDCAITVIAWRAKEYTHVFGEVWYNNSWHILDPTLKENGFGEQDKKIKRYKRVTKKDMAKLQVLSDESGSVSRARRLIPTRRKCYGNDDRNKNKNTNNININFGTNVEHSHNVDSGDDGRFVSNDIPKMQNLNVALPKQNFSLPIIRPTGNNNFAIERNTVAPEYRGFRAGNKVIETVNKKVIVNNRRPKFVPNSSKNYYPEFP